jgi:release factor glutamine methyltransferase
MSGEALTLGALRRMAAKRLSAVFGSEGTPALDSRLLIAAVLDIEPNRLSLFDYRAVSGAERARIEDYLDRRIAGEPVARIIGTREFWGLPIGLSAATLVPRPDTEILVEAVLAWFDRHGGRERVRRVVDLGTGSGAILLALASALPEITALGIDLSEEAVRTARDNAEHLGLADRCLFVRGDWSQAAAGADIVVSNPPYIQSGVMPGLPREVRDYDPSLALDGGADGLDAYRAILADLRRVLVPGGALFLEIGFDQDRAVSELVEAEGFATTLHRDLAGWNRVVEAERISRGSAASLLGRA